MPTLSIKKDKNGVIIGGKTIDGGSFPPPPPPPPGGDNDKNVNSGKREQTDYTPYIIGGIAVVVIALLIWILWSKEPTDGVKETENSIEELDPRLKQLIQDAEEIFQTKNVARAKKALQESLTAFPDNQEILQRIHKCDDIIRAAKYSSLNAERGVSPDGERNKLGFADTQGYIVIDFLYDEEIGIRGKMIALKNNGQYGIVGGDLKDGVSEFKYKEILWISGKRSYYRLVKNNAGEADEAKVENGKLIIKKHNTNR